jgi:acyl-CoA dehydrogenase
VSAAHFTDWPFFAERHRDLATALRAWAASRLGTLPQAEDRATAEATCRRLVRELGEAGWLRHCLPQAVEPGASRRAGVAFDVRALALIRETLARHHALADFAFAMQGLGSSPIALAGSPELRERYLPRVASGEAIAAFALSEAGAGSDVAALRCRARRVGDEYMLEGEKTWISNGGIADFYCVFARTSGPDPRPDGTTPAAGISAFVVDAASPGLAIARRIDTLSPHPLATIRLEGCSVPATRRLGAEGEGFKLAMRTLDVFRLTQAALADMACGIDAARLLTYRAAWLRDRDERATAEVAMAKMTATETAQRVIDRAVQLLGARGVARGETVEHLYRDIRALRIYEGATEVQQLIIGRDLIERASGART